MLNQSNRSNSLRNSKKGAQLIERYHPSQYIEPKVAKKSKKNICTCNDSRKVTKSSTKVNKHLTEFPFNNFAVNTVPLIDNSKLFTESQLRTERTPLKKWK